MKAVFSRAFLVCAESARSQFFGACIAAALAALLIQPLQAQEQRKSPTDSKSRTATPVDRPTTARTGNDLNFQSDSASTSVVARLSDLQRQIRSKKSQLATLKRSLKGTQLETLDSQSRAQLTELPVQINKLQKSFEQIAVSGLDLSALDEEPRSKYNWQDELLEIVRPVIGSLKDITAKPRKIEQLRQSIERSYEQRELLSRALVSVSDLQGQHTADISDDLALLRKNLQTRLDEANSNVQVFEYQLQTLEESDVSVSALVVRPLEEFVRGRGLTLTLAMAISLLVWLGCRSFVSLAIRLNRRKNEPYRSRERALRYLGRGFTLMAIIGSILTVFYLRSDMLLLALSIITLVMIAAGLRQAIPRYIKEIRILLDFGSVRAGERIIVNGIPLQVCSIHAFAKLRNPMLEGELRVGLDQLIEMTSRPIGGEPWFPCKKEDYLLLPDKRFAQVVRQSVENVQLRMLGSVVQVPTAQLIAMAPANLSAEGFVTCVTFGLDYRHQSICQDVIPQAMLEAVQQSIDATDYAEHCESISVEFKEAGSNSLDYLVAVRMAGAAASNYFAIGRRVQQALVTLCNNNDWVIPFGQLTIHQGEGFNNLRATAAKSKAASAASRNQKTPEVVS